MPRIRKRTHCSDQIIAKDTIVSCLILCGLFGTAAQAFAPPQNQPILPKTSIPPTSSSSSLFGVRSAIRKGFHKIQKPFRKTSCTSAADSHSSTRSLQYHESAPAWYQANHHNNGVTTTLLMLKEEDEHDHHRQALAAAFHHHSPAMFNDHHPELYQMSLFGTNTAHHPLERLDDEEEHTTSNPQSAVTSSPSLVQRRRLNFQSDEPLYVLPASRQSGDLNRLEAEFRDMLSQFSNYSMRDLYALRDPRMRTLVHGVAASGDDPEVYRAFEILFQDLMPLRLAGRLVFTRLKGMMDKCIQVREEQIAYVVDATGLDARDVEEARIVFFEVASKLNHDVYLTTEQMTATKMFHSIRNRLNLETPAELVQTLDRQQNGKIGLEDFLVGLHQCAEDQCELEQNECYALEVVHELLEEIDSMENPMECATKTAKLEAREAKELKHVMRYDEMLEIFKGWRDQVPGLWDKKGRKWEVVQGCFVGAENEKVVDALRIVYVDYAPLRVAAEFILSLAASLLHVKPEVKR